VRKLLSPERQHQALGAVFEVQNPTLTLTMGDQQYLGTYVKKETAESATAS